MLIIFLNFQWSVSTISCIFNPFWRIFLLLQMTIWNSVGMLVEITIMFSKKNAVNFRNLWFSMYFFQIPNRTFFYKCEVISLESILRILLKSLRGIVAIPSILSKFWWIFFFFQLCFYKCPEESLKCILRSTISPISVICIYRDTF